MSSPAQEELSPAFNPQRREHSAQRPRPGHRIPLVWCPKCLHPRLRADGPHSPHQVFRSGQLVLVDCKGDEIS